MSTTTCQQCGAEVDANAAFCSRCGAAVSPGTPPPPSDAGWTGEEDAGEQSWSSPPPGGLPPGGTPPPPLPPGGDARRVQDQQNLGLLAHLSAFVGFLGIPSFVGPLIMWLVKRDDPFVAPHAVEALNFQLSVLIYAIVGGIIAAVGTVLTLGIGLVIVIPLAIALVIAWVVVVIQAGLAASRGQPYRYPVTIRMVK